jgi:hypothetical protein
VDLVAIVEGIRVDGPLEIAQCPTVESVVTAIVH